KERPQSYRMCVYSLQSFLDFHKEIQVKDLRAVHVGQWLNAHPTWNDSTKNSCITWVLAALNWAAKPENRYLPNNPIAGLSRPPMRSRGQEAVIEPAEHDTLYAAANPALKDVL